MKTVFNNSEVCHIFARQTQDAGQNQGRSIFFDGNTIFSYGRHFPMVSIPENLRTDVKIAFITNRSYSNTTAKHLSNVRRAISHFQTVYCYNPQNAVNDIHGENIRYFREDILQCAKLEIRARKKSRAIYNTVRAALSLQNYVSYCPNAVKHLSEAEKEWLSADYISRKQDAIKRAEILESNPTADKTPEQLAKIEAAKQRAILRALAKIEQAAELWRNKQDKEARELFTKTEISLLNSRFKGIFYTSRSNHIYLNDLLEAANDGILLRQNVDNLETSKGIVIPLHIAQRYYQQYRAKTLGGTLSGYSVKEQTETHLIVGCHTIPNTEIELLAAKLNWNN